MGSEGSKSSTPIQVQNRNHDSGKEKLKSRDLPSSRTMFTKKNTFDSEENDQNKERRKSPAKIEEEEIIIPDDDLEIFESEIIAEESLQQEDDEQQKSDIMDENNVKGRNLKIDKRKVIKSVTEKISEVPDDLEEIATI